MTVEAIKKMPLIKGSEADVYLSEDRAYRVSSFDLSYWQSARDLIGKRHQHVVVVFNAWREADELIIEMERLSPLEEFSSEEDREDLDSAFESGDNIQSLSELIPQIRNKRIAAFFEAQVKGARELGLTYFDIGPQNCMSAPDGTLKIIDLW